MAAPGAYHIDPDRDMPPSEGGISLKLLTGLCAVLLTVVGWILQEAYAQINQLQSRMAVAETQLAVTGSVQQQLFAGQTRMERQLEKIEGLLAERHRSR